MSPKQWKDYYQILQVHYDASPDVIKAAYRKLCSLYHPDCNQNPLEDLRMQEINEAYRILSNTSSRTEYHRTWLSHSTTRDQSVHTIGASPFSTRRTFSKNILDQFFDALLSKKWDIAYSCLTLEDQEHISYSQFKNWREAVSSCFEMQDYNLKPYRTYQNCRIGNTIYPKIEEFAVVIHDMDLQTNETSQNTLHKYVAFDNVSWKVCLGIRSVKQSTLKYRLLAERRQNFDPVVMYKNAVEHTDPLTGLLSKSGFYDDAFKEVERYKRYQRPFSIIAFKIHCKKPEREISCTCHAASIFRQICRTTDLFGRFDNNTIIGLLPETDQAHALLAAQKYIRAITSRQNEPYNINAGVLQYANNQALEQTVFAACSDATKQGNRILYPGE